MKRTHHLQSIVSVLLAVAMLAGCADVSPSSCPAGLKTVTQAELFFGRNIPGGGQVGDDDWRRFLDEEVTSRFPDGLTVQDAIGQWRDKSGIVHEQSKRLTIVLSGADGEQAKLEAIRIAYKSRFHQDAVLMLEDQACGAF